MGCSATGGLSQALYPSQALSTKNRLEYCSKECRVSYVEVQYSCTGRVELMWGVQRFLKVELPKGHGSR